MEKIFIHPSVGPITLRKRVGNRSIRISVHPRRGVLVTLPWHIPYSRAIAFVEEKKLWINEVIQRQKKLPPPASSSEIEALRRKSRAILVPALYSLAVENGFTDPSGQPLYHRVAIKNNVSNWGSCSGKNNINLNMHLVQLPLELQRYVLLHELCHLRHHDHGPQFHQLLNHLCHGQEKELSHQLRGYRLL